LLPGGQIINKSDKPAEPIVTADDTSDTAPNATPEVQGIDPDKVLYRFGAGPETTEALAADAARAAGNDPPFPHGISTMSKLPPKIAASGQYRSATAAALLAAGFQIEKTGGNPYHYTVHLPRPVTGEVTDALNRTFGGYS
jgi:hypothetical protein